jgi:hypothetical protein
MLLRTSFILIFFTFILLYLTLALLTPKHFVTGHYITFNTDAVIDG